MGPLTLLSASAPPHHWSVDRSWDDVDCSDPPRAGTSHTNHVSINRHASHRATEPPQYRPPAHKQHCIARVCECVRGNEPSCINHAACGIQSTLIQTPRAYPPQASRMKWPPFIVSLCCAAARSGPWDGWIRRRRGHVCDVIDICDVSCVLEWVRITPHTL